MKKYIEAVNEMDVRSFRLLRLCLGAVLASALCSLVYSVLCTRLEREIMSLLWADSLTYIMTALSVAFGGTALYEVQIRQNKDIS